MTDEELKAAESLARFLEDYDVHHGASETIRDLVAEVRRLRQAAAKACDPTGQTEGQAVVQTERRSE